MSDDNLVETVKQLEKSENVIVPTPVTTRTTPFDIFKTIRGQQSCSTRKSVKSPNIYKFNPIRSSETMNELSKKRWVSLICAVLISLCDPPQVTFFVWFQLWMKQLFINITVSKSLPKPRSSGLLGPITGGGHSGQKFSIKDTPPRSPIIIGKLDPLMQVPKMWMSCRLTSVTSWLK